MIRTPRMRQLGFTMVELVVAVSVVVVLGALLLPAVQKVREASNRTDCANKLKQFGVAMFNYYTTNGTFTEGTNLTSADYNGANSHNKGCFVVELLPYLGQETLYASIRGAPSAMWTNPNSGASGLADVGTVGAAAAAGILPAGFPLLRCPSDSWFPNDPRLNNYVVNIGPVCMPGNCATVQLFYPYCQPGVAISGNTGGLGDSTYGYTATENYQAPSNPGSPWFDPPDPVLGSQFLLVPASQVRGIFARFRSSPNALTYDDVPDGLGNTIMMGERLPETDGWYLRDYLVTTTTVGWGSGEGDQISLTLAPINYPWHPASQQASDYASAYSPCNDPSNLFNYNTYWGFKSYHPGGCNFALADGSVHFISQTISQKTYMELGCRNDGHLSLDF